MNADQYKKHTHREHILELPDTYIGSIDSSLENRWVWNAEKLCMEYRQVKFCPGFLKIFDEILVNALDHRVRQDGRVKKHEDAIPVKHIDVSYTPTTITVRNDGDGIPTDVHKETGLSAPELIFGHLLTSSNYDKTEEKVVGGKNGYGAKLTNIFSKDFSVETVEHRMKKRYVQTWTNNMTEVSKPKITAASVKPYTEVRYTPDLSRFLWGTEVPTTIPEDMLAVIATRVIDAAACAGKECKVTLNGQLVATNTFPKFISLYLSDDTTKSVSTEGENTKRVAYEAAGERWEVGAILTRDLHGETPPDERHITFVNGIATRRGGKHLDYVSKAVLNGFCELAKRKAKLDITPALLKESVVLFVNSTIVNPSFDTQSKETLTTPSSKFGSLPTISPKFLDQLVKIGLLQEAQTLLEAKTARDAKRTDGKKKSTVRGIAKLDDAGWAGTARSSECTLILTEGDSAKTTAISGLKVVGREKYGVFPLKGKILNVKDVTTEKKTANQELAHIKQILGLESGKVYKDLKQLRYGRIMIMTDQDVDGSHIKGLLMNLFHTEWPSLLQQNFICCLMTPLLKASKGAQTLCFYSESEYEKWLEEQGPNHRGWSTKYYKGLGTSTASEARDYFATMNTVEYSWDDLSDTTIDLAFNKKRADDRKQWLTTYDRARHLDVKAGGAKVNYTSFVNDELIHFSIADNIRSLPNVMDGLKPSQRKIFWSSLKRNLTKEIRVAQLAGYVSETAAYHHGEASLTGAIIGMAQNYVGSNNLNLLAPNGQFGTRLMGGSDAASARYIHTELMPITRALVKKEDDAILTYLDDDGLFVEPETYYPVVPLILINGALGIGTGFSTNILPYNPKDLVAALKWRLTGANVDLSKMEFKPWWFGFKGKVQQGTDDKTWITKGVYEFVADDSATIRITELPIGTWTQDYKDFLESVLTEQETAKNEYIGLCKKAKDEAAIKEIPKPTMWLKGYEALYNDVDVDFLLQMDPDYYHEARAYSAEFETRFKLNSRFKTTNMVAFDTNGLIRRFGQVGEILEEFYSKRLQKYGERKAHELDRLAKEIVELTARHTFVKAVVERRLVVANAEDEDLLKALQDLKLPTLSEGEGLKGYEYLLKMRVDRLKASAVKELESEVDAANAKSVILQATKPEELWLNDLDAFDKAWVDYVVWRNGTYESSGAAPTVKKKVVRKVKAKN